jgi:hypothetical protein
MLAVAGTTMLAVGGTMLAVAGRRHSPGVAGQPQTRSRFAGRRRQAGMVTSVPPPFTVTTNLERSFGGIEVPPATIRCAGWPGTP